jgi:hypothetical protein
MEQLELWIGKLISFKLWVHASFCGVFIFVFSISVLLSGNKGVAVAGMLTCLFVLGCSYVGRWFGKAWLSTGMHASFLQKLFLGVLISTLTGAIGSAYLYKANIPKYFLQYLAVSFPLVVLFIFFGMAITMARNSIVRQVSEAQLLQQQKESELRLLLSQLSPHFLFNTLNNIYGISLTQHQRVPSLLLKLSELLRYSVYETRAQFIPLQNELLYIHNYIDFEKIQTGDRLVLKTAIQQIEDINLQIAPMLLIVFVENAFKYSKMTRDPEIFITIDLYVKGDWIYFKVENSYNPGREGKTGPVDPSGVGLHHTLKRLNLIYGKNWGYQTHQENGTYNVELSLNCSRT